MQPLENWARTSGERKRICAQVARKRNVRTRPVHGIVAGQGRGAKLAAEHIGVIAWTREANPAIGEYGEPTILLQAGDIPDME